MATAFTMPVTAAQVGTYFVGRYYQMLQDQPDFVHQFYSDASTMLRIDGNMRKTATAMLQIHQLVISLNYVGLEIKSAHSLESWNGGVLVMVSGSVCVKDYNGKRKFVETFFLAPQEMGFFILNDIFHFVEEEPVMQHPIAYLTQSNINSKLNSSANARDQVVSSYMLGEDIHSKEFVTRPNIEETDPVDNYNYSDQQLKQVPETENILDDNFSMQSNGSLQGTMKSAPEPLSSPMEEPAVEPQKHTYASIVAKGQAPAVPTHSPSNNPAPPSEWHQVAELPNQSSAASANQTESSGIETQEEVSPLEDEVEFKSVYVRNVPTTMAASEIAAEFKKFGKLRPEGVAIRTRKDIDVCYAFVEFEDVSGVHNAIQASTVQIGPYQLYIEGRRPNRNPAIRGGRGRGRGRVNFQMEGTRGGRFGGRGFVRATNQDGVDRGYNKPRGNGFYRRAPQQDREYSGYQEGSRNGYNFSE